MGGHDQAQFGVIEHVLKLLRIGAALRQVGDGRPNRPAAGFRYLTSLGGLGGIVLIVGPQAPDPHCPRPG
jgi:hypothetical protein